MAGATISSARILSCVSLLPRRTITNRARLLADAYGAAGGFSAEVLAAVRTVAALGMERFAIDKYAVGLDAAQHTAIR